MRYSSENYEKVKTETGWKNQLIKHIGTAKSDDELAIYLELAKKDIAMLANQLSFDFDSQLVNGPFLFLAITTEHR